MQEMVEEHAARQVGSDADDDLDDGEDETVALQKRATVKITLPSKASVSTPNNLSSNGSTKAKINSRSSTTPRLKRKRRSSRKKAEEESDSADLTPTDEEDQNDDEDKRPSPSKRTRGRAAAAKAKSTPMAITPSTRTLRPRIPKTQTEEERQNGDD